MRVSTQVAVASLVAVLAVGAIAFFSHQYVRSLEHDADEIAEEWNEMDAITGALAVLRAAPNDGLPRSEFHAQSERLRSFAEEVPAGASVSEHEDTETRMFIRLAELLDRATDPSVDRSALANEAEKVAISFWKEDIGRVPEKLGTIRSRQRRLRSINIGTGLALLLVPALVLLFIHFRVARPLARIQSSVERVGGTSDGGAGEPPTARLERTIGEMVRAVEAQRQKLEAEVATRTEQLHHANRLGGLGRISAAVAHEINTPLGSIALCLQGLQRALTESPLPREEIDGYLVTANGQIEACTATTRKLLSYAHLQPQESARATVAELVHEALELVRPHCRRRGVSVDVDLAEPDATVAGDLAQLRQVLVNLLLNAADASPRGESIRVETGTSDGMLRLRVSDKGPGVPAAAREEIFNPFFTTKRVGEGTGLGLSIAREIADAHGGSLELLEPESGAAFELRLPEVRETAP